MTPDQTWLDSLVGKRVLVGLAWEGVDGAVTQRAQFYGTITTATPEGVVVRRADGKRDFTLPPSPEFLRAAAPGQYRLRSSGEIVDNPDLVCAMRLTPGQAGPEIERDVD